MESIHSETFLDPKKSQKAQLALSLIREQYLQAKPPQQIEELKNLFQKYVHERTKGATSVTSTKDHVDSSIRKNKIFATGLTPSSPTADDDDEEAQGDEDLDSLGNKTKEPKGEDFSSSKVGESESCKKSNFLAFISKEEILLVMGNLYESTLGHSHPPLAEWASQRKGDKDNYHGAQNLLHPPIQYRIAFAKHIIKQLEPTSNRSAPQGSNEKDIEDPIELEALLERWYEGLEVLCSGGQAPSEPFYRLYEIEVVHHYNKEESRREMVKIFENETSFVADGTTGLVTWKASTEFLKWLSSYGVQEKNGTLWTRLDGTEQTCKWVVELGCGCGLLAIGVSKFMPPTLQQYIATDGSTAALERAKLNAEANFYANNDNKLLKNKIRFERVEWQNEATHESFSQLVDGMTTIYGGEEGVLLGADIIFDPQLLPDLVKLLKYFLDVRAGRVILSSTIRSETTMKAFSTELDTQGLGAKVCGSWQDGQILEIINCPSQL